MITLRPFQEKALAQYREAWGKSKSHLGIAPTAFGKTAVSATLASRIIQKTLHRFVMIAHRESLVTQNAAQARLVDPSLKVGIEMAGETADDDCDFISASVQTLQRDRLKHCAKRWKADGRPLFLIGDECHHFSAASYRNVVEALVPDRMLGLTATPFRKDDPEGISLREFFPEIAFNIPRGEMIDEGWLAKPLHWLVRTQEDISKVAIARGDYVQADLARMLDIEGRNALVIAAAAGAKDWLVENDAGFVRGVCFAISVEHAYTLADLFREKLGWDAAGISAETPVDERHAWDQKLKNPARDTIVCSMGIHTEGWDVEQVNVGLFARPTKSPVLAEQMLGRVMRMHPEKPAALVIDFQDVGAERVSIASTFKLPGEWDAFGGSLRDDQVWFGDRLKESSYSLQTRLWRAQNRDQVNALLRDQAAGKAVEPVFYDARGWMWWDLGPELRMVVGLGSVIVRETDLGDFEGVYRHGSAPQVVIGRYDTARAALAAAEGWALGNLEDAEYCRIAKHDDGRPASDAQVKFLKKYMGDVPALTVREARIEISQLMIESARKIESGMVGFGKYRGAPLAAVPTSYLSFWVYGDRRQWLVDTKRPELGMFERELAKRGFGHGMTLG